MKNHSGFTLVEIIVVLILVGMLSAIAGFGLVAGVQGYLMTSENAELTQKAQLAMFRLSRELIECDDCDASKAYPDTFSVGEFFIYRNNLGLRVLELQANDLTLNGRPLIDKVNSFSLSRDSTDGLLTITLGIGHQHGGGTQTFQGRVYPRNLYN